MSGNWEKFIIIFHKIIKVCEVFNYHKQCTDFGENIYKEILRVYYKMCYSIM